MRYEIAPVRLRTGSLDIVILLHPFIGSSVYQAVSSSICQPPSGNDSRAAVLRLLVDTELLSAEDKALTSRHGSLTSQELTWLPALGECALGRELWEDTAGSTVIRQRCGIAIETWKKCAVVEQLGSQTLILA